MKTFGIILLIMLVIFGLGAKAFLDHASPEHEHSYGEWTTKTPATCTEAGVEVRVSAAGLGDTTSEPSGIIAFYNALNCKKALTMYQNRSHTYNPPISVVYSVSK